MANRLDFPRRMKRLRSLPVAPTLLTGGNLACGVTTMLYTAQNMYFLAAIFIFIAMVCDMFDGKVARMTGTDGAFGAELDSLADIVSFGVAPAFLVHRIFLGEPGVFSEGERFIWLVTIFYSVMAAIRLARYNVEKEKSEVDATSYFRGLPSPGAAALICSWVLCIYQLKEDAFLSTGVIHVLEHWGLPALTIIGAFTMVSNIRFAHLGNTLFSGQISFRKFIFLCFVLFIILYRPIYSLAFLTTAYVLMGLVPALIASTVNIMHGKDVFIDDDDDDDDEGEQAQSQTA